MDVSAKDYYAIGLHFGQSLWTFRMSVGDNSMIEAAKKLDGPENQLFWILWIIGVVITMVVFLNFIVAEASGSYAKVTETLDQVIWQEKCALIMECEEMSKDKTKTSEQFPKYLICRQSVN